MQAPPDGSGGAVARYSIAGELLGSFGPAGAAFSGLAADASGTTLYASLPLAGEGGEGRIAAFATEDGTQAQEWALPAGTHPRGLAHHAGLLYVAASPAPAAAGPAELLIYGAPRGELLARWALADSGTALAVAVDGADGAVYTAVDSGNGTAVARWRRFSADAAAAAPSRVWEVTPDGLSPGSVTQLAADGAAGTLLVAGARTLSVLSAATGQRLGELGGGCAPGAEAPCPAARSVGVAVDVATRMVLVADEAQQRVDVYRSM